jgi:uncharacterized DUF497 family protein
MSLIFEWDESKNRLNVAKHRINFRDVQQMFDLPLLIGLDEDHKHDEFRWRAIGWLGTVLCLVVYSEPMENSIRIISVRKATKRELKLYGQVIEH